MDEIRTSFILYCSPEAMKKIKEKMKKYPDYYIRLDAKNEKGFRLFIDNAICENDLTYVFDDIKIIITMSLIKYFDKARLYVKDGEINIDRSYFPQSITMNQIEDKI